MLNLLSVAGLVAKIPAGLRGYLITGVASLVAAFGAYEYGYICGNNHAVQVEVAQVKNDAAKKIQDLTKLYAQEAADRAAEHNRDLTRESNLVSKLDNLQNNSSSLQRKLISVPDNNRGCYLSSFDVSLLNASKSDPGSDHSEGVSNSAGNSNPKEQAPSSISCRDLVSDDIDVSSRYNALAASRDALVDWVQVELIDAQAQSAQTNTK